MTKKKKNEILIISGIGVALKGVSHENSQGSKMVSIERSSFGDVSAGSLLTFYSGAIL